MSFYSNTLNTIRSKLKNTAFKTDYPEIDDLVKTNQDYYNENPEDFIRRTQKTIVQDTITGERYAQFITEAQIKEAVESSKKKTGYLEFFSRSLWDAIISSLDGKYTFSFKLLMVILLSVFILRGFFT